MNDDVIDQLQSEIFKKTGMNVDRHDPLIAMACIQKETENRIANAIFEHLSEQLNQEVQKHIDTIITKNNEHVYQLNKQVIALQKTLEETTANMHERVILTVNKEMEKLGTLRNYKQLMIGIVIGVVFCSTAMIIITKVFKWI
jgi:predicted phage tail protein